MSAPKTLSNEAFIPMLTMMKFVVINDLMDFLLYDRPNDLWVYNPSAWSLASDWVGDWPGELLRLP